MDGHLDLEDLSPKALRKLIRSMIAKGCPTPEDADKEADKVDDERHQLSEMHAARKGRPPEIPVGEDDLPFETDDKESDDDSEASEDAAGVQDDEAEEKPAKKMPPQFKKKGGE